MSDTTGQTRYFRDRRGNRWRVHPDGRTEIRWSDTDPWRTSAGDLAWLLDHSEITEEAGPTPAEDTTGQTPARDEMVKAGAEAILHYMGEWGTDDVYIEAKAHELSRRVLEAALAGRTVGELPDLTEALARAGRMIATDARDWGLDRADAWLWGLLCGWDCEDHLVWPEHKHDDLCADGGAMREVAARHGWTDDDVARLRRYRAAIRSAVCTESGQDVARACCDLHNAHCEPPSELCCHECTEAQHPQHPPGVRCVLESGQDGEPDA